MNYFNAAALCRAVLLGALLAFPLTAQAAGSEYDKLDKGPKVGAAIPQPLTANDQNGNQRSFASLAGKRGTVLLFARSLNW